MAFLTSIIARLLGLQDAYLAGFVDVSAVTIASPNGCPTEVINASVNSCGQEVLGGVAGGGLASLIDFTFNIAYELVASLVATSHAIFTPYIPPIPPTP